MELTHVNPDTLPRNPAFSQALLVQGQDVRAAFAASQEVWGPHPAAVTVVVVAGLAVPGALVEIEAVCALAA